MSDKPAILIREYAARRISNRRPLHIYACGTCGEEKLIERSQASRSNGCDKCSHVKHGMSRQNAIGPMYRLWQRIIERCYNAECDNYYRYGGRGISVLPEWRASFKRFRSWCLLNGYRPDLQIDRIDVNGNYTPDNCRFVTCQVNSQNRRSTKLTPDDVRAIRMLSWSGAIQKDVAEAFGVSRSTVGNIMAWKSWSNV